MFRNRKRCLVLITFEEVVPEQMKTAFSDKLNRKNRMQLKSKKVKCVCEHVSYSFRFFVLLFSFLSFLYFFVRHDFLTEGIFCSLLVLASARIIVFRQCLHLKLEKN